MLQTYGRHRKTTSWFPLIPTVRILPPLPPPEKVYHDREKKCLGCPYPAHGLMCHDNRPNGSCLRIDMQELDARHRKEYLSRQRGIASHSKPDSLLGLDMAIVTDKG